MQDPAASTEAERLPRPALERLDGATVLVRSTRDRRNPPTGIRGSVDVKREPGAAPEVRLIIDFPQMFTASAHRRTLYLDPESVRRLQASEHNGAYEFTIDDVLE